MDSDQLAAALAAHARWLENNPAGARADLREADLQGSDLQKADLREADLQGANLRGANLWRADLRGADLWRANLREADLQGSDLREANLREADLREADLQGANLWGANLRHADLDFSAWPFWCGTMGAITDDRLKIQLLAHVAVLAGDITDPDLVELLGSDLFRRVVTKCHRARELGLAAGGGGGEE